MTEVQKVTTLQNWLRRHADGHKSPVTADELIARIKKNWPTTSDDQVNRLYQLVGHL